MPKFSVASAIEFRSPLRNEARWRRAKILGFTYIVTVEVDDGSWCELDADDLIHGRILAKNWVDKLNARGATVWSFNRGTGRIRRKASFTYYWNGNLGED